MWRFPAEFRIRCDRNGAISASERLRPANGLVGRQRDARTRCEILVQMYTSVRNQAA